MLKRRRLLFIRIGQFRLIIRKSVAVGFFILAAALLVFSKIDSPVTRNFSNAVASVLSPGLHAVQYPLEIVSRGYNGVIDVFNVYHQNKILKEEYKNVMSLKAKIKTLQQENDRLAELLSYAPPPDARYVTAKVIAQESDGFSHSLIVYLDSEFKVKSGQAVLADTGVIGRVETIGNSYARVILLTDINSKIPVITERTKVRGILSGDNTSVPKLIFTQPDAEFKKGDVLVTSGVAGIFPDGLLIGKISRINKGQIEVNPADNLNHLDYVRIVDFGLEGIVLDQDGKEE